MASPHHGLLYSIRIPNLSNRVLDLKSQNWSPSFITVCLISEQEVEFSLGSSSEIESNKHQNRGVTLGSASTASVSVPPNEFL